MPLPFYDPFIRTHEAMLNCGCCQRGQRGDVDSMEIRNVLHAGCRYDATDPVEHRCTPNVDDTICSQRNCPASLHLQALASQFLSLQGIIPCAATRLLLRKVPGSNVTTTMEETITKAQKAISILTKDQLLTESRNVQQVNTLINLHMTANPPPNVIPVLTLVQLKMNLLKVQVEGLINQKIMEIQGVGVEVTSNCWRNFNICYLYPHSKKCHIHITIVTDKLHTLLYCVRQTQQLNERSLLCTLPELK